MAQSGVRTSSDTEAVREPRATHQCATSCFLFSLPFSPSFFLWEEWEEVIIQRPPAPMPQLLSSMALCLFREGLITLSGVTLRSKRETEWKFIGRWRRGGEAERKGETWVMDEFDTLACAMWNSSTFILQMTDANEFFLSVLLSLPPLVGLYRPCQ